MATETNAKPKKTTRREFVAASGAALSGAGVAAQAQARPAPQALAAEGGPPAVTFPNERHAEVTRWPRFGAAEKQALGDLFERNRYYGELPRFEQDWKDYLGVPFVKSHCNCTSALTSMFFALDLPPGSEILVPSYTFFATVLPMRLFGYVPAFVDIDPRTCCFDVEDARRKLTPRTRALIAMHAWGLPCEMDHIQAFAQEHGLVVVEDAAQAHGAAMQGKKVGAWGEISTFSFQQSKVMTAIEGGVGCYQSRAHYERAAAFGHYLAPPTFPESSPYRKYEGTGMGVKFRMHPFAAAVARAQLKDLDGHNARVRRLVRQLNDRLLELPGISEPRLRPDQERVYYSGNMLLFDQAQAGFSRQALIGALKAEGVRARLWMYPQQHKFNIYSEQKWWHHKPVIPEKLAGSEMVNATHFFVSLLYEDEPELIEQYVKAFQKVWAHRQKLARA